MVAVDEVQKKNVSGYCEALQGKVNAASEIKEVNEEEVNAQKECDRQNFGAAFDDLSLLLSLLPGSESMQCTDAAEGEEVSYLDSNWSEQRTGTRTTGELSGQHQELPAQRPSVSLPTSIPTCLDKMPQSKPCKNIPTVSKAAIPSPQVHESKAQVAVAKAAIAAQKGRLPAPVLKNNEKEQMVMLSCVGSLPTALIPDKEVESV